MLLTSSGSYPKLYVPQLPFLLDVDFSLGAYNKATGQNLTPAGGVILADGFATFDGTGDRYTGNSVTANLTAADSDVYILCCCDTASKFQGAYKCIAY